VADGAPVTVFAVAVFLRLDVPPGDLRRLAGCTVGLAFRRGNVWVPLAGSQVDSQSGAATGLTGHFTLFQVRAVARAQPHLLRVRATPQPGPGRAPPLPTLPATSRSPDVWWLG
jgi:hypothetical protein